MLKQMGGDMSGASTSDLKDIDDIDVDSDDEPMPDLEEALQSAENKT